MATPAPAIMDLIHVGAARRRPSRCGRAISAALVLLTLSGCGGPTVVATAPAVLATASLPTATPTASASAPPPTPSAAPTPRTSPGALPPLEPPDGVILKMRDANYAISGDTAAELVAEMVAEKLVDPAGDAGFALTTWDVDWTYKYVSGPGGSCGIGALVVKVDIKTTLPTWKPPPTATALLVDNWTGFIEALVVHERGHAQNGLDRAGQILVAMGRVDPKRTCKALERVADAAGETILANGRQWDITYDAETDHGATQGASFP